MLYNLLKYGFSELIAKLAPFLTTLYVANALSPELFGKYGLIMVFFELSFIIISFNIRATTRIDYFRESTNQFVRLKQNHFIISILFSLMTLLFVPFINDVEPIIVLLIVYCAFIRTMTVFLQTIFQCSRRANAYIYSNLLYATSLAGTTLICIEMGASYLSWLYGLSVACSMQLMLSVSIFGIHRSEQFLPEKINFEHLKYTFVPAILFMPQAIGWWLKSGADRIIISNALGNSVLGQYTLGFQFATLILIAVNVLNLALVPELNTFLKDGDRVKADGLLKKAIIFVTTICVCSYYFGGWVLSEFYSNTYVDALNFFQLLVLALLPQAVMMVVINVLYFIKDGGFVAKLIIYSFSIQLIINYQIVNHVGVEGMIICSMIINVFVLASILIRIRYLKKSENYL